jgi:uncharacterized membrane protein HdeD (DUF308 family)
MKTIGAIIATLIVQFGGDYILHDILLKPAYDLAPLLYRSQPAMMHHFWSMIVGQILFAIGAVLVYQRGRENKPWLGQGIRFGILLAIVAVAPGIFAAYTVYPIRHELALHWMIGDGILAIIDGIVIAAICQTHTAVASA